MIIHKEIKERTDNNGMPIIYSCSGCSDIAQLANYIAVEADKRGIAEMSCIAGVGGGVKPLVKKAKSGRKIIAVDGCPLQCSKHCLNGIGVEPDYHYILTDYGLRKNYHANFNPNDGEGILIKILQETIFNACNKISVDEE